MNGLAQERPILDVSQTPTVVFGNRSVIWLGTVGLMAIEGTMFAIAIAAYFYLRTRVSDWPPGISPPEVKWGTFNLVLFLASGVPNHWIKKFATKGELNKVRLGLLAMTALGLGNLALRCFEFAALNCQWDQNAYASIVWFLLGLHTTHLLTDWVDTVVVTALMHFGPVEGRRFMDVAENADYWYFVLWWWAPIYLVLYWAPRWL